MSSLHQHEQNLTIVCNEDSTSSYIFCLSSLSPQTFNVQPFIPFSQKLHVQSILFITMRRRKEAKTLQYMYLFSYFVFFHHGDKLWDDIFFTFYQVTWLISFTTFIVQYHIIQDTTLNNKVPKQKCYLMLANDQSLEQLTFGIYYYNRKFNSTANNVDFEYSLQMLKPLLFRN